MSWRPSQPVCSDQQYEPYGDERLVEAPADLRDLVFLGVAALASRVAAPRRTRHNGPMTKSELIHRIVRNQPHLTERDVETAVKMILDQMVECLAGGRRIEIRGFGSFTVRLRRARVARNPRTGAPVSLPARYAPYFKPGKKLRERVDLESRASAEV